MAGKTSKKIEMEQRRKQVAANLLAGMTYRDISEALGIGLATISRDKDHVLKLWREDSTKDISEMILMEDRRLDVALNAIMAMVRNGNLGAIDRMLAIMDKRMKLKGLDSKAALDVLKQHWRETPHGSGTSPYFGLTDDEALEAILAENEPGAEAGGPAPSPKQIN